MLNSLIRYLDRKLVNFRRRWERAALPEFSTKPRGLVFETPRRITNPREIEIGDDCYFGPNSCLTACREVGAPFTPQSFSGRIVIGNRVWATHGLQVFAAQYVEIGDDVMIAGNVFICDCQHGYTSATAPYKQQPFFPVKPIKIGAGCWIGQNVVIMPGVEVGDQSIIGANSVVTRSIPPATIVAGVPARNIRRYDFQSSSWIPTTQ
jgi:acetyltransferase-like isoleucine patch superfamily enzyme